MLSKADYVGSVSGKTVDKSNVLMKKLGKQGSDDQGFPINNGVYCGKQLWNRRLR